jgi:phosphatidylglycerol:prolipoprotein diacylglycerol transferase
MFRAAMRILALAVALLVVTACGGLPYFDVPVFHIVGSLDIQVFGMLVATGVLVGAELCRRYSLRYGVDDDDLRKLTGWVVVTGFIGAHVFDVLAYQSEELSDHPLLLVQLWKGISSYGGFIGGSLGFAFYVWHRRFRPGLMADVIMVGLLPGFTIGRIGCSIVHDHIGRATDFFLGFDYPQQALWDRFCPERIDKAGNVLSGLSHPHCALDQVTGGGLPDLGPHADAITRAHNLGFYELIYLIPVCAVVLSLAFSKKRLPAGLLAVLVGVFYAPVRFFFEFLRLNQSDPRYAGLTFAQWASIFAFGVAGYTLMRLIQSGKPAPLDAELGDKVGGYRDDAMAPKRASAAADDSDESDDDADKSDKSDKDDADAKPKKAPAKKSSQAGKRKR